MNAARQFLAYMTATSPQAAQQESDRRGAEQVEADRRLNAVRRADRLQAAQQEADRLIAGQQAAQPAAKQEADRRLRAAQQAAQQQATTVSIILINSFSEKQMTPSQLDQADEDFFSTAFSGTNRFARNSAQQDEAFRRITTSVPAQSAVVEPIRPNIIHQQPPETIVIPPEEEDPAEPQELYPPQSVPSETVFVPPAAPGQPSADWRANDTTWDYKNSSETGKRTNRPLHLQSKVS